MEISLPSIEPMPLRSLFNTILGQLSTTDARLAAEEAKSAADDVREALQDASGVLLQLAIATAASDLSGVLQRVGALEANPFNPATIEAAIADISGVAHLAASTAQTAAADVLLAAGAVADLSGNIRPRVDGLEAIGAGARLDAVEAGVVSKVAQAEYDSYVAANDSAVAAKADASALADYALAANVEAKGVLTSTITDSISFLGINSEYWGGIVQQVKNSVEAGHLAVVEPEPDMSFFLDVSASATKTIRIKNSGTGEFNFNTGNGDAPGETIYVAAGETITAIFNGSAWILV